MSQPVRCSFCGKSRNSVKNLINGPAVRICNECVSLCQEIIATADIEAQAAKEAKEQNDADRP